MSDREPDRVDAVLAEIRNNPPAPWLLPEHIASGTELRRLLGNITRATLIAWRRDRGFPEPVKQLEREAVWDIREVRAWMRKR
jgi:predicted DNA-binding transcriptional regulator AlpA